MIIAIASEKNGENLCPHFGRAPEYTFITIEDGSVVEKRVVASPGHSVGSIPHFIIDHDTNIVIAGGIGTKAIEKFKESGIEVLLGVTGAINDIVKHYLAGDLETDDTFDCSGES